jgi:hypothetical protein
MSAGAAPFMRPRADFFRWCKISALLALAQGAAAPAFADIEDSYGSRPPAVTPVYQVSRPSYDAAKIALGSFLLAPSFSEMLAGDDNIFASDRHLASDLVVTTSEDLSIQSQWLQNGARLRFYHSHQIYANHAAENANIYGLESSFRFDLAEGAFLELDAGFVQQPQKRNSPQADRLSLARPIYNTIPVSARYSQDWERWHNQLEIGISRTAYISNANASRSAIQSRFHDRLSFALAGDSWSFLQVTYSTQDWRLNASQRNFNTLSAIAGINVQLAEFVDAELGAGVLRQQYLFAGFKDLVTPTFSGHLTWNILPLTSVSAAADQTVTGLETFCDNSNTACTALSGSSLALPANQRGALEVTSAMIGIQHEFWHNILGEARFRFEQDKFDTVDLVDRNYFVDIGTHFLLNRNLELDIAYAYNIRTANQNILLYNSGAYQADTVTLALKAAL